MADERLRAWVSSIDATYELVENPEVRKTVSYTHLTLPTKA